MRVCVDRSAARTGNPALVCIGYNGTRRVAELELPAGSRVVQSTDPWETGIGYRVHVWIECPDEF